MTGHQRRHDPQTAVVYFDDGRPMVVVTLSDTIV
jgi:hypothetical protein